MMPIMSPRSTTRTVLVAAVLALAGCTSPQAPAGAPPAPSPAAAPTAATPSTRSTAAPAFTPVTAAVLADPTPVTASDGRVHLAYELQLTNTIGQPATVAGVEARSGDRVLLRLDGDALAAWIRPLGGAPGGRVLQPGQSALIWLDVTQAPTDPRPVRLEHRLDLQFAQPNPPLVPAALTETVASATVVTTPARRISPPLPGPGWLDGDSCCAVGGHRGAVSPIDGRLWAPERYAIDYVRLDDSGRMITGDPTAMASYPYVGTDVLAVADGPVVGLVGDLPEQTPGANPSGLALAEYGGNHVVQDLGDGHFAFYAHLQPGNPLGLAVGQQLRRGQVLGKLGNSGNTSAPHLHFHLMNGPDPLAANGLPFVFDTFDLTARATSNQTIDAGSTGPVPMDLDRTGTGPRRDEMPLSRDVMSYPTP
jgi:Peptidase family M23